MARLTNKNKSSGIKMKDNRKIVLSAPEIGSFGGIQTYMGYIHNVLSVGGCNHKVVSKNDMEGSYKNKITNQRMSISGGKRSRIVFLRGILKIGKVDTVIVGHLNQAPLFFILKTLGFVREYIVVLHGIEAWKRLVWYKKITVKKADLIVATTEYTIKTLMNLNEIKKEDIKSIVIPLCTIQKEKKILNMVERQQQGLMVGRLSLTETDKGYEHAIKAIKELNEEGMGCKLIVVGDGNYRKKLEEIAFSTGGSSNIEFTGFIDRDQLDSLYGESLFFLLPSRKEGFGIVYLEAMSRGTPCIGGNYGGVPEVIDNNLDGYLVEFGNIADIKEAVKKIINDKHMYEHMQRKIEKKIATKFSYSYFEAKWLDILSERTS